MAYNTLPSTAKNGEIQPFNVNIPGEELDRMNTLLKLSRVASPCHENSLPDGDPKFGLPREWLLEAKRTWETSFNWRSHEKEINAFPHFTTTIPHQNTQMTMHFTALFSTLPTATPILLLHGWPGSFLEFLPMLHLLRTKYPDPSTLPYHLIVPSLPGFAFSSPFPTTNDNGMPGVASIMNELMSSTLGFGSYIAQGGDIGSRIGRIMAAQYDACTAALLNYSPVPAPPGFDLSTLTETERNGLKRAAWFRDDGCAYAHMASTRPSTTGLVLSSNPLALLAWIGEKYLAWTDPGSFPHDATLPSGTGYSKKLMEGILLSVSLYWLTGAAHTCLYSYREAFAMGERKPKSSHAQWRVEKPKMLGYEYFPYEVVPTPWRWVATSGNLVFWREHKVGGHFAALEQPGVVMSDLEEFVRVVLTGGE
ncbi:hypothetical protein OQA88_5864 [Cercophora sp. LCS_1]